MLKFEVTLYFEFWGEEIHIVEADSKVNAMKKVMNDNPEAIAVKNIKCLNIIY
jgi:hypothetical protein